MLFIEKNLNFVALVLRKQKKKMEDSKGDERVKEVKIIEAKFQIHRVSAFLFTSSTIMFIASKSHY